MRSRAICCLSAAGAAGALALPACAAAAAPAPTTTVGPAATPSAVVGGTVPTVAHPLPTADAVLVRLVQDRKAPFVHRDVRLATRLARVRGEHLATGYAAKLRGWPMDDLKRHEGELRRAIARARRAARAAAAQQAAASAPATSTAGSTASGTLQAIARCESGGNPSAVDPSGTYRGKYQFTYATWAAMGGTGDPAAAPVAEQDAMAAKLYATAGAGQWPVCGR